MTGLCLQERLSLALFISLSWCHPLLFGGTMSSTMSWYYLLS